MKSSEKSILMINKINRLLKSGNINDWEKNFLTDIRKILVNGKLTEKQKIVFDKIIKKVQ